MEERIEGLSKRVYTFEASPFKTLARLAVGLGLKGTPRKNRFTPEMVPPLPEGIQRIGFLVMLPQSQGEYKSWTSKKIPDSEVTPASDRIRAGVKRLSSNLMKSAYFPASS